MQERSNIRHSQYAPRISFLPGIKKGFLYKKGEVGHARNAAARLIVFLCTARRWLRGRDRKLRRERSTSRCYVTATCIRRGESLFAASHRRRRRCHRRRRARRASLFFFLFESTTSPRKGWAPPRVQVQCGDDPGGSSVRKHSRLFSADDDASL